VLGLHEALVEMFAHDNDPISPSGLRERGLLESAVQRPRTSLGKTEKYASVIEKASALFHSLIKNHPFHNGNKRTALVALVVFLDENDFLIDVGDDELFDFVLKTAQSDEAERVSADAEVQRIHDWLSARTQRRRPGVRGMRTQDFAKAVESAGGRVREIADGHGVVIWGPNGQSIRIGKSTTELNRQVVKRYLSKVGLSEGRAGIYFAELEAGVSASQRNIRRFRNVLRSLAAV
jgi:death-on-curing family protein